MPSSPLPAASSRKNSALPSRATSKPSVPPSDGARVQLLGAIGKTMPCAANQSAARGPFKPRRTRLSTISNTKGVMRLQSGPLAQILRIIERRGCDARREQFAVIGANPDLAAGVRQLRRQQGEPDGFVQRP